MDFTDRIEENIQKTAEKLQSGSVIDVESMIPLMDESPYPNKIMDVPYGTRTEKEKLDIFIRPQAGGRGLYLWKSTGAPGTLDRRNL